MFGIFFIATAWGRNNGGINSVNYALIRALSEVIDKGWKIYTILTEDKIMDSDIIDDVEKELGVTLISVKEPCKSRKLKRIIAEQKFEQIFFVGHDVITGECANKLKKQYSNSISIIFHHMSYKNYYYLRENNPEKIRIKEEKQKKIIPNADIIVPIGPLLKSSAHDLCIDARRENKTKIHELIPGLEEIEPINSIHENHTVVLFGRIEEKNNCVKQIQLAVDALAKYISEHDWQDGRFAIKCYGYADDSGENQNKLQKEFFSIANKTIPITANSYITNEEELFDILVTASLCIMPSFYEGFGLTGYEAIAAGVPVIISKNTGLYKFLESWSGTPVGGLYEAVSIKGDATGNDKAYTDSDLQELTNSIENIFLDYKKHKENALKLRQILLDGQCTWEYAARTFLNILQSCIKTSDVKLHPPKKKIEKKKRVKIQEYIRDFLIPEFCELFCNSDEVVIKIIKYSQGRERRFTVFSSDEKETEKPKRLPVRSINDGTVGILNNVYVEKKKKFPLIISNFVYSQCYLIAEDKCFEQLNAGDMGVPDHHVLAIIVAPILYKHELVGAVTLDVYDDKLAQLLTMQNIDFMENMVYTNVKHLTRILKYQFYNEIIDDLNFSEVQKMITKRALVSFSGKCPLNCKHCFTKEIVANDELENEVVDVVKQLEGKEFDVVYISHYKENFYDPEKGVQLCEQIYKTYQCDICVTTRCIFTGGPLARIKKLNQEMCKNGNNLTFCISVPAYDSYNKIEDETLIPTPQQRIDFAGQLKRLGITSIVTIRPLFPDSYIPQEEIHTIIDACIGKADAIITGGLCVTDRIINDLDMSFGTFSYLKDADSEYLKGVDKKFKEVDVRKEMKDMEDYCQKRRIPFFRHTLEALNYFAI